MYKLENGVCKVLYTHQKKRVGIVPEKERLNLKNNKNSRFSAKRILIPTALILLLTFAASATVLIVNAHTPAWQIPTFAYVIAVQAQSV